MFDYQLTWHSHCFKSVNMISTLVFGAIGYSLIYMLLGGGFGGAVLIFIIAKMLGK